MTPIDEDETVGDAHAGAARDEEERAPIPSERARRGG